MARVLKMGVPKGSLNSDKEGRGNTEALLIAAGYDVRGYTPGKEQIDILGIYNDPETDLRLFRPQNGPGDLIRGIMDIAILGKDWALEESDVAGKIIELADLEYGGVDVVFAVPEKLGVNTLGELLQSADRRKPIEIYSEYPKLTSNFLLQNLIYQKLFNGRAPVIEIRGIKSGENEGVQIIYSEGNTEQYILDGFPIVDNKSSGNSLRRAGGIVLNDGLITTSSARLYARPGLEADAYLWAKAQDIKTKLRGAVEAMNYENVKFNIEPIKLNSIIDHIYASGLGLKGPSVQEVRGPGNRVIGYAVELMIPKKVYPATITELLNLGAEGIATASIKQLIR